METINAYHLEGCVQKHVQPLAGRWVQCPKLGQEDAAASLG